MTTYPLVRFVDSPDPDAVVRFDFNDAGTWSDGGTWPEHEGFSLGAPTLEGDPDGIGAEDGLRELTFNVLVEGDHLNAQRKMGALARELRRPRNWLLFQFDEFSVPVWFHTYKSAPSAIDFEHVAVERASKWGIGISLDADPFAYGERETLAAVTIANDPAAATNPLCYVLPEIKGDATTPLTAEITWSANRHGYHHMLAISPSSLTAPIVWQIGTGDAWTAGTDTGAAVANAAYSGGSYRAVSFATDATLETRLSGDAPAALSPGRYRVMLRAARSDTTSTFSFRLGSEAVLSNQYGEESTVTWGASTAAGHAAWVDLGVFHFPTGSPEGASDLAVTPTIDLQASRVSGAGALHLDAMVLVPLAATDSRALFVSNPIVGPAGSNLVVEVHDAEEERVWHRGAITGAARAMYPPEIKGGFPVVTPGEDHIVHLFSQVSASRAAGLAGDVPDVITSTATVTLSYYPRYLWLGGS